MRQLQCTGTVCSVVSIQYTYSRGSNKLSAHGEGNVREGTVRVLKWVGEATNWKHQQYTTEPHVRMRMLFSCLGIG